MFSVTRHPIDSKPITISTSKPVLMSRKAVEQFSNEGFSHFPSMARHAIGLLCHFIILLHSSCQRAEVKFGHRRPLLVLFAIGPFT